MFDFIIATDSTCDLPDSYYQDNEIELLYLACLLDGETYADEKKLDYKVFYEKVRNGSMPSTSQVNPDQAKKAFETMIESNKNILYLAFSSGLSGTYQSVVAGANEVMEEHPDVKIVVIDSLCASLGEGLYLHKAVTLRKEGKSMDEIASYLEEHKMNFCHVFTVDDLNHLHRGGRVSKTTAIIGTMVGIKPLLHVDNEGHLINIGKCRGRKKSLISLVDMMEERIGSYKDKNDIVFISHGDCEEDAQFVADEIKARFGIESFLINPIGPVIGSHAGPGTVALFFMGDRR